ncbi:hypothetical protein, partial [Hallerella succinigenes]|uniref:hypothetical protein n=1 Tax=Hallerella succinigenes TaxID=1896222 RepID=UPI002A7FB25D
LPSKKERNNPSATVFQSNRAWNKTPYKCEMKNLARHGLLPQKLLFFREKARKFKPFFTFLSPL